LRLPALVAAVDRALVAQGVTPGAGRLLVGLSGGPDSVALLDALVLLRRRRRHEVHAAHLDHGLRSGSRDDVAFCRVLCRDLDVPLHVAEADVRARAQREPGGLEQAARRERYAFLERTRLDTGAAFTAVAHTRDDQAETLLLHLLRGAGTQGLGAMRGRVGALVRPLLAVSREQVLAHLRERGLSWREDPSNDDLSLLRNRVRHELLPYLEARFNPRLRATLARTAGLLSDEAAHLREEAGALLARIGRRDGDAMVLERRPLVEAPLPVARVVVRQAIEKTGGLARIGSVHVERILVVARSPSPSGRHLVLPGGREVRYRQGELRLGPRPPVAEGHPWGRGRKR